MTRCYIGLGANLGDRITTLRRAADALERLPQCRPAGRSPIYRSAPVGPGPQPEYLNAVLALDTEQPPLALLGALQSLENDAGRRRDIRWGARTLDLDLLLYGHLAMDTERLTVPHPGILERNFVLRPLGDLLPGDFRFADGSTLAQRLRSCPDNPLHRSALRWSAVSPGPEAASA